MTGTQLLLQPAAYAAAAAPAHRSAARSGATEQTHSGIQQKSATLLQVVRF